MRRSGIGRGSNGRICSPTTPTISIASRRRWAFIARRLRDRPAPRCPTTISLLTSASMRSRSARWPAAAMRLSPSCAGSAGVVGFRGEEALSGNAGDHDFHRRPLPLRPERGPIVLLEHERAAGIKGVRREDSLVRLARNRAGLTALSVDEANDGSARPRWPGRTGGPRGPGWSGIALFALGGLLLFARGERQRRHQQGNHEPADLHGASPDFGDYQVSKLGRHSVAEGAVRCRSPRPLHRGRAFAVGVAPLAAHLFG